MTAHGTSKLRRFSVGLTGGIGCGKTTVANMFSARGVSIIDTDQISHALTTVGGTAIPAISEQFGAEFLDATGAMDRAKMRAHVFENPAARVRLESILHPRIFAEAERMAEQAQGVYIIFVVPLLLESGNWKQRVSRILVIDCPESRQIERIMGRNRNGMTAQQARAIMATQVSRETRLAAADDVIFNDRNLMELEEKVDKLHTHYTTFATSRT